MKALVAAWKKFWFTPFDADRVGLFRAVVGFGLFFFYSIRLADFEFLYGATGVLPYEVMREVVPEHLHPPIPFEILVQNPTVGFFLHIVLLMGLLALGLGLLNRPLHWILLILHLAFFLRNRVTNYGADLIATQWLFLMSLIPTDRSVSVKNMLRKEPLLGFGARTTDWIGTVGVRLIQIQLCIVYAYSGLEKARGWTWWRGDAIWLTLANGQMLRLDFSFLHHFPALIAALTFVTVVFETYFIAAVWTRWGRPLFLWVGIGFHLSIGVILQIPFFSLLMMAPYLFWWDRLPYMGLAQPKN